ncbi:MAG: hypothetical protein M3Q81_01740 [bacterium]|nr:hypothetical protein [bacterium]
MFNELSKLPTSKKIFILASLICIILFLIFILFKSTILNTATNISQPTFVLIDEHPLLGLRLNPFRDEESLRNSYPYLFVNGEEKIIIKIVDKPQEYFSFSWLDNSERITYMSYSILSLSGQSTEITIHINHEALKRYNWNNQMISSQLEVVFYSALFSLRGDKTIYDSSPDAVDLINNLRASNHTSIFWVSYE